MIYFDNNATHPLLDVAKEGWLDAQEKNWYNPAGATHVSARVRALLKSCREELAGEFDRSEDHVIFTSGATESNNLAIYAFSELVESHHKIACNVDEHASVLEPVKSHFRDRIAWFNSLSLSNLDTTDIRAVILSAANSETGEIYPLNQVLELAKAQDLWTFCDATQWIGKYRISESLKKFHFISGSAHKFGGPKGLGFLILPKGMSIPPLLLGGGQQLGVRSGTENYPCVAAMMKAWEYRSSQTGDSHFRDSFEDKIINAIPNLRVLNQDKERLWNTTCLVMPKHKSENWLIRLEKKGFLLGTGSACATFKEYDVHPLSLKAVLSRDERTRIVRVSGSFESSANDWNKLADAIIESYVELEQASVNSQVIDI